MASDLVLPDAPASAQPVTSILHRVSAWQWAALAAGLALVFWVATGTTPSVLVHLWTWAPVLARGMFANIGISLLAMALGTVAGLVVGGLSLSPGPALRAVVRVYVQAFRNAPVLVLIYFTTYVFPF